MLADTKWEYRVSYKIQRLRQKALFLGPQQKKMKTIASNFQAKQCTAQHSTAQPQLSGAREARGWLVGYPVQSAWLG
ncbi:hypothetical protein FVEG_16601 [Fusarium verticillioides 7600]|uniref:Uncharacterized protein n=1 Tax=Gibberella moniliformis (strain M3125 / FGSC 7600) TaxID=334819 RepID=W7MR00_GIBM7|nr:hypothetical protein FVEG_16601 [Fusarium verticillioides 7600]EWG50174.1 hypothetical protein FVEG_16601 [Fusarium verticillioides 7600]